MINVLQVYYTFKEAILADPAQREAAGLSVVGAALGKYRRNMWEDLQATWKVLPLCHSAVHCWWSVHPH